MKRELTAIVIFSMLVSFMIGIWMVFQEFNYLWLILCLPIVLSIMIAITLGITSAVFDTSTQMEDRE